ncbi:MAG: hypothetical protein HYS13_24915 [Planctomycetia bacterium]|nr:hypothetical protein [Planctomycetia bacterium]
MAQDPRKRQRKLERRKAKQKAEKKALARRQSHGAIERLERAATAPVLHCCAHRAIFEQGMGQVLVSRQLDSGNVAFALFLVDLYCLGVKDAMSGVLPRGAYEFRIYDKLLESGPVLKLKAQCARKLVEGSVAYADDLGFAPHADHQVARLILGDIDASACAQEFTYGKDGKPLFIAGPYDDPDRCRYIVNVLADRMGEGGYHYVVPAKPSEVLHIMAAGDEGVELELLDDGDEAGDDEGLPARVEEEKPVRPPGVDWVW